MAELVVGDDDKAVHVVAQLLEAAEAIGDAHTPLEGKGQGDDPDGEDAHLFGRFGDDGSCAGAGAAAHTGGDEDHFGAVFEEAADVFDAFLAGLFADGGLAACAASFSEALAEDDADRHGA